MITESIGDMLDCPKIVESNFAAIVSSFEESFVTKVIRTKSGAESLKMLEPKSTQQSDEKLKHSEGYFTTSPEVSQMFGEMVGVWAIYLGIRWYPIMSHVDPFCYDTLHVLILRLMESCCNGIWSTRNRYLVVVSRFKGCEEIARTYLIFGLLGRILSQLWQDRMEGSEEKICTIFLEVNFLYVCFNHEKAIEVGHLFLKGCSCTAVLTEFSWFGCNQEEKEGAGHEYALISDAKIRKWIRVEFFHCARQLKDFGQDY
ncbi:hypothetical protein L1987_54162 [Smallanthus sonchifolius]|uniref:Uncharacterized protein n=1 Tax=Smallanthus sonchifolius TaxID=185202 RepID=A0ACB9E608_9ASTR|nr:hypothetical protein L1987_54162 [Smallanthus sonchifolius]